jgi:hypothetical protein
MYLIHHHLPEGYEWQQQTHSLSLPKLCVISLSFIGEKGVNALCDVMENHIFYNAPIACVQFSYLEQGGHKPKIFDKRFFLGLKQM